MNEFRSHDATASLRLLSYTSVNRNEQLEQFNNGNALDSGEEEPDSPASLVDQFYNEGGSSAIKTPTNFEAPQLEIVWTYVQEYVKSSYNVGRGKKSKITAKDSYCMLFTKPKHGR